VEATADTKSTITLLRRAKSQLFFNVVTTISNAFFLSAMNKSLRVVLREGCMALQNMAVAVAATETHRPPCRCTHIYCLASITVQQASMNVSGFCFFHMEEFSGTPLPNPHFHGRHHLVGMPLCCPLSHGNKMEYWWEGSACSAISP